MSPRPHGFTSIYLSKYAAFLLIVCLSCAPLLHAATEPPSTWAQDLSVLKDDTLSPAQQQVAIARIRDEAGKWLKLHPASGIELPEEPAQPWTADQLTDQVKLLRLTVESILHASSNRPFHPGTQEVNVTETVSPLSPVSDTLERTEIANRDANTLTEAITEMPGVSLDRYASRGQAAIYLRGFDVRGVPVYLDGIPVTVPYDGHLDFNRFLTSDIAEIQVAKGYTSALMGPNAMGGAINLVTREPREKYEGELSIGTSSGDGLLSGLHLASRQQHFFVQAGLDWAQSEFYPISHDFVVNSAQPTDERVNSYQRDERYSARLGWIPRSEDSYSFSYVNQKANFGAPPYSGVLPTCLPGSGAYCDKAKFWKWPDWNKQSYYLLTHTRIGETGSLQLRAYFDRYPTETLMYDNESYSTMTGGSTGILLYDDHSDGISSEVNANPASWNKLGVSFFFKDDTHRENGTTAGGSTAPLPWIADRDQISSYGIQDGITIRSRFRITAGFSADHQDGLQAQRLTTRVVPFPCQSAPAGTSFTNCTAHFWSYNPALMLSYTLTASDSLYATFSDKSRFATIKERYSGRFGLATPNPNLGPEHAQNWTFGYSHAFASHTVMRADIFRSDVRDAIENATIDACNSQCNIFVNVGKEKREGFEFALRSTVLPRVTLDANYSYLNRAIEGSPTAVMVNGLSTLVQPAYPNGTPKHKVVGTATARLYRRTMLVASVLYEAGVLYQNDGGNNTTLRPPLAAPKFATVDLGGSTPIYKGVNFQAGVKNLFDRYYWYQEGYPEEGRNWYLNLRYRF